MQSDPCPCSYYYNKTPYQYTEGCLISIHLIYIRRKNNLLKKVKFPAPYGKKTKKGRVYSSTRPMENGSIKEPCAKNYH
ncbi:hypothetical protein XBFM1_850016 [Xenorhabdus bovienii str. feltiae Moldova]|uniref:Uncharacterized protein n=1 Tax=Xenorhabdus bovienii str. feltiae Moldova TaxID=1398200 RepID=A0A077NZC6_XENBV|nr:hypothetical protein XBFM1_850016 [Xenorhabdus bovienii str. feltiae Moldova]